MSFQFTCRNETRRALARDTRPGGVPVVNGIDYLEVGPDQVTLRVRFIHNLPGETDGVPGGGAPVLDRRNFAIDGGERVTQIRVTATTAAAPNELVLQTSARGDFSAYRLRLVSGVGADAPPAGFDPALSAIAFSFKIDCPSDFDCADQTACPPQVFPAPKLDYLAKDYASFRRLLLDRLALTMPQWRDRNAADIGVTLVELLAYAGDQLSYFQDAVATEAYIGTARQRVSMRRHARLLDYAMHEGVNARAWVTFEVAGDLTLPRGTLLLTKLPGAPAPRLTPGSAAAEDALRRDAQVFETLHAAELHAGHHRIELYTWGDAECCLPRGATRATLRGDLALEPGDVLVFEEALSPRTGLAGDADPAHRQAVRVVQVTHGADPLGGALLDPPTAAATPVTEIEWHEDDALGFALCLSSRVGNEVVGNVSVARGNVVLADHGRTVTGTALAPAVVPEGAARYRPRLPAARITQRTAYDHAAARTRAASGLLAQDPRAALPAATLAAGFEIWEARRDLLASDRFATDFVVETESDGGAFVRFGDGVQGRTPSRGTRFALQYRQGGGGAGNVGADTLFHVVTAAPVMSVRNPLPATGGQDPEALEAVRLAAPVAFRGQERAVTPADYEAVAERHPQVQKAKATRRWTGSWHTMFVTVDRRGGADVDTAFEDELRAFLEAFRLAGHDIEIDAPRYVPLDVSLRICVKPGFVRADVKATLVAEFGRFDIEPGRRGVFHPDALTFGEPVYLSVLLERAMAVQGVAWIEPLRFQRWGVAARGELAAGRIAFDRLEIARLDNDPNAPENGRIDFVMEGGL
jgi:hypothetical protein